MVQVSGREVSVLRWNGNKCRSNDRTSEGLGSSTT